MLPETLEINETGSAKEYPVFPGRLVTVDPGNVVKIESQKGIFWNVPVDEAEEICIHDHYLKAFGTGEPLVEKILAVMDTYHERVDNICKPYGLEADSYEVKLVLQADKELESISQVRDALYVEFAQQVRESWKKRTDVRSDKNKNIISSNYFSIYTTPEFDAIEKAASDGKSGKNYSDDPRAHSRRYKPNGQSHYIELRLTEQERLDGIGMDALTKLTADQDSDCIIALLYVTNALLKNRPEGTSSTSYTGGWIDIDDVVKKTGWTARNTTHRLELRRKAFRYLQFGARAIVIGNRTYKYFEKDGAPIDTRIEAPLWAFLAAQQRVDSPLSLFPSFDVPVQQEIVLSREWLHLVTRTDLAHMLPMGEVLGSIPADQPSGAWARVIGLALANLWRRESKLILAGELAVPRKELLTRYTPKLNPVEEILKGRDPGRALQYWHQSLDILVDAGFLAKEGSATERYVPQKEGRKPAGWKEAWLNTKVLLHPSTAMQKHLSAIAKGQCESKPRNLSQPKQARSRKKSPA